MVAVAVFVKVCVSPLWVFDGASLLVLVVVACAAGVLAAREGEES